MEMDRELMYVNKYDGARPVRENKPKMVNNKLNDPLAYDWKQD